MIVQSAADPLPLHQDSDSVIRVGNTRVTLDTVVIAFDEGLTAEEIASQYPSLRLAEIYLVIGHILNHRTEIDEYLNRRKVSADAVRVANESRFDPNGIRKRLQERRQPG